MARARSASVNTRPAGEAKQSTPRTALRDTSGTPAWPGPGCGGRTGRSPDRASRPRSRPGRRSGPPPWPARLRRSGAGRGHDGATPPPGRCRAAPSRSPRPGRPPLPRSRARRTPRRSLAQQGFDVAGGLAKMRAGEGVHGGQIDRRRDRSAMALAASSAAATWAANRRTAARSSRPQPGAPQHQVEARAAPLVDPHRDGPLQLEGRGQLVGPRGEDARGRSRPPRRPSRR